MKAQTLLGLPLPPSANALFIQCGRRRVKSRPYATWRQGAAVVARARLEPVPEKMPLAVTIVAHCDRRRDIDNLVKPILDMLGVAGIVPDDRYVDQLAVRRETSRMGCVSVRIEAL